ncbi:citrate synthase, putative [Eimeria praecox]|uniref:Citrate synthase, putative n=1 Tax=Eimeria praecox TaxID=51316 RepID=U6G2N1_9EIME|nr:citrate synthase, putative [Eimeria praecox]
MSPRVPSSAALDAGPIHQKAEHRGPSQGSSNPKPSKDSPKKGSSGGLAGVVAGESTICTVALGSGLNYRGYNVVDLAREATFEEVVHLLLLGELPNQQQLATLKQKLYRARQLPPQLLTVLKQIPKEAHPMDVLRTTCSVLGTLEPESNPPQQQVDIAIRLIGGFGGALNYWYHYANSGKEISLVSDPEDSVAKNFLKLMNGDPAFKPHPVVTKTLDASLILYAEHDFNGPSVWFSRVFLQLEEAFARRELIMGFGHRMYKHGDPRAPLMRQLAEALARAQLPDSDPDMVRIGAFIEEHMLKRKNMHANVDFSAAIAYKQCGVPIRFFTPLFAIARTAGWAAHVLEQRAVNKLIRPTSIYKGPPPRPFLPMGRRGLPAKL